MKKGVATGVTVGASSISLVSRENGRTTVFKEPHKGKPEETFQNIIRKASLSEKSKILVTGRELRKSLGFPNVSEPQAVQRALDSLEKSDIPEAVVSFGGQSIIVYQVDEKGRIVSPLTFNKCGSGTGDFFLQQIKRLGFENPKEAVEAAMELGAFKNPYVPASRCSVFCKSDCTHACNEHKATPAQIVAGICKMVSEKISELLGKIEAGKIWMIGGGSQILPVIEYLKETEYEVFVPEEANYFESWGASLLLSDDGILPVSASQENFSGKKDSFPKLPALESFSDLIRVKKMRRSSVQKGDKCILSIDVGSTTTKMVLVKLSDLSIVASHYGYTLSKPHIATINGIGEIIKEINTEVEISGMIVTGSGRYLVETFLTDFGIVDPGTKKLVQQVAVTNEITCHAKAAGYFNSGVKTILEIGGQDAKYTSFEGGVAVDYAMNEACSAGTGSFLAEVVKEIFGIKNPEDIAPVAEKSSSPLKFGEQCSAFIESDINVALHGGSSQEDVIAGLCYSICFNYINRVVGNRPINGPISIQGGTAYNRAFCLAMAGVLKMNNLLKDGEYVVVSSDAGLMGAIGGALDLKEKMETGSYIPIRTTLKKLVAKQLREGKSFECRACDYKCRIQNFIIDGKKVPFGGFCRRWDSVRRGHEVIKPEKYDLTIVRDRMLFQEFSDFGEGNVEAPSVGMLGNLFDLSLLPFFSSFFSSLGMQVVLADEVDAEGVKKQGAAFCWPVERSHGLLENLIKKNPDFVFLPHIKGLKIDNSGRKTNECCPLVQGSPFYLEASFSELEKGKILKPFLDFTSSDVIRLEMMKVASFLGVSGEGAEKAFETALERQEAFEKAKLEAGRKVLKQLESDPESKAIVVFGRPYNAFSGHLGVNKGITRKISSSGVIVIPMDFLPLEEEKPVEWMFWPAGSAIMKAAKMVRDNDQLFAAYLTNFSCGPDGFVNFAFRDVMGSKPSLTLEFDGHTANAGFDTRIEAFLDIVEGFRNARKKGGRSGQKVFQSASVLQKDGEGSVIDSSGNSFSLKHEGVKIIFMDMGRYGSEAISAVTESLGFQSRALPPASAECLQIGRRYSSCKECLPYNLTLGSMIRYLEARVGGEKSVFFMPTANGPCRFGMYSHFMKRVIEKLEFPDAAVISLSSENRYAGFGKSFNERAWIAMIVSDIFDNMAGTIQALAVDKEMAASMLEHEWLSVLARIRRGVNFLNFFSFRKFLRGVSERLREIPLKKPLSEASKILIAGEIYVRRAEITTHEFIQRLSEEGFVVWKSSVGEWIKYNGSLIRRGIHTDIRHGFKFKFRSFFEEAYERGIVSDLAGSGLIDSHIDDVDGFIDAGGEYINPLLKGEAVLTVGTALKEVLSRFSGAVILGPFGCMPTRIASSILSSKGTARERPQEFERSGLIGKFSRYPILPVESDGGPLPPITLSQLEVFSLIAKSVGEEILKH